MVEPCRKSVLGDVLPWRLQICKSIEDLNLEDVEAQIRESLDDSSMSGTMFSIFF